MKKREGLDMPRFFQLDDQRGKGYHAGSKAPADVAKIAKGLGFAEITAGRRVSRVAICNAVHTFLWLCRLLRIWMIIPKGSVLLYQHPRQFVSGRLGLWFVKKLRASKKCKFIFIIHDVDSLRDAREYEKEQANVPEIFSVADVLISHNSKMSEWLRSKFVQSPHIVDLHIFDYITESGFDSNADITEIEKWMRALVFAGNLSSEKSPFIAQLKNIPGVAWWLYGSGARNLDSDSNGVQFCGSFDADNPPAFTGIGWGLVWDGEDIHRLKGAIGGYLKYINSHKLSLYLAMGLPVVCSAESAVAMFVKENQVGIVVDDLTRLPLLIETMDRACYAKYKRNAIEIAGKLRSGYFTAKALLAAIDMIRDER